MHATYRILLLEDDYSVSDLICDALAADYEVEPCYHPRDGLALLGRKDYDLLILDLGLPGIDGVQVIQRVRGDPSLAHLRILVMSAYHDLRQRVPVDQVSGILAKPFSIHDLVTGVESALLLPRRPIGGAWRPAET